MYDGRGHRHDEDILDVEVAAGVQAARDHVDHGEGQGRLEGPGLTSRRGELIAPESIQMNEQFFAPCRGGGVGDGQGNAKNRVCTSRLLLGVPSRAINLASTAA